MSAEAKPTPIVQHLQNVLVQGRDMAARPALVVTGAQMWIMRARAVLGRVYGENAPEVDIWCPRQNLDPTSMSPQNKVASRLSQLERFATLLTPPSGAKVFIGHGRSPEWLKLRIFLSSNLGLSCDEFNIEPIAGLQTADRIQSMLNSARLAFLVMTAEDQHVDGTAHARQNVVHEIGLFQAALGRQRAIVMLELGCSRFSNLDGLTTISFPKGDLMARSEEVRGVLARERMLPAETS